MRVDLTGERSDGLFGELTLLAGSDGEADFLTTLAAALAFGGEVRLKVDGREVTCQAGSTVTAQPKGQSEDV